MVSMTISSRRSLPAELLAKFNAININPDIFLRWPDYRVLAIVAYGIDCSAPAPDTDADSPLSRAEAELRARGSVDWTNDPHISQWMAAYTSFGAKPKRTSPSVFALLKRVDAGLPRIDPVTDLYNAVSIAHALPIGGEDFDAYVGSPHLTIATGDEPFDTIDKGEPITDHPSPGEVIWRDDIGVTCRRWNWRQGVRTRIVPATTTALFLLEALGAMTDEELGVAGDELMHGLRQLSPNIVLESRVL
jgi:DNA/RNA-binding domain of Phe-tRNA-synthetase-like protein